MVKEDQYRKLVLERKNCRLCKGLTNPAAFDRGRFDSDHIGPWSLWQHNLDADIMIVGQDWGDNKFFKKWSGKDPNDGNPTNENLLKLLESIGVTIGKPREKQGQKIFLTNLILCLKKGGLQALVSDDWFNSCTRKFFKPLVEIIRPKAILALGKKPTNFISDYFGVYYSRSIPLKKLIIQYSPFKLTNQTLLFPLYHCGAGGINRNRSFNEQMNDWKIIKRYL
jgi:DNA polymerase